MSDLVTFTKHVQDVLRDAYRRPHWTPAEAEEYMANVGARRKRFEELASHLNRDIVKPRLEVVARLFPNASLQEEQRPNGSSCLFDFCDRFPTITEVEFSLEHDVRFEKLIVHTQTHIMPVFVRYNEQDNLLLPLDTADDEEVADWVEERLLEFLDTYLRIDASSDDLAEEPVTDPVCGMQILQSTAAANDSYYGHPYFFCSEECRGKFQEDPTQYVQIKMM